MSSKLQCVQALISGQNAATRQYLRRQFSSQAKGANAKKNNTQRYLKSIETHMKYCPDKFQDLHKHQSKYLDLDHIPSV